MVLKRLTDLIKGCLAEEINAPLDLEITGLAYDSRRLQKGEIFVAIKGEQADGHDFIAEAQQKGAAAVIVEEKTKVPKGMPFIRVKDSRRELSRLAANFYGHPSRKLKVIGITGTNGKTTTAFLIQQILKKAGLKCGLIGTVNYDTGREVISATRTTPESLDLQKLLSEMTENGLDFVVMEVSAHALSLKRVNDINFKEAIFTNFSQDHLDFYPSLDGYLKAKLSLFAMLSPTSFAIINNDDPAKDRFKEITKAKTYLYGFGDSSLIRGRLIKADLECSRFKVYYPQGETEINFKLKGRFNIYNALAAFGAAYALGLSPLTIKEALTEAKGVPGRLQAVDYPLPFKVIIDYAHTPDGLQNVLEAIKEITPGRIITVFGAGGNRDRSKRPLMGEVAGSLSDIVIVTSDNPRKEDPQKIIEDILEGLKGRKTGVIVEIDRRRAIARAFRLAAGGDTVLIAGKGHETYQIIGEKTIHFDDYEVALEEIQKLEGINGG